MDDTTLARFSLIGMNIAEMAVPTIAVNNVNHQNLNAMRVRRSCSNLKRRGKWRYRKKLDIGT